MADSIGTDGVQRRSTDGVVWRPSAEYLERSRLRRFMERHGIATLDELNRRSVEDQDWFWRAVSDDLDLEWYRPFDRVVDTSRGIAWPSGGWGRIGNVTGTPSAARGRLRRGRRRRADSSGRFAAGMWPVSCARRRGDPSLDAGTETA